MSEIPPDRLEVIAKLLADVVEALAIAEGNAQARGLLQEQRHSAVMHGLGEALATIDREHTERRRLTAVVLFVVLALGAGGLVGYLFRAPSWTTSSPSAR